MNSSLSFGPARPAGALPTVQVAVYPFEPGSQAEPVVTGDEGPHQTTHQTEVIHTAEVLRCFNRRHPVFSQFSLTLIVDTGKMCQICKDHFTWKVLGPHRHYPAVLTVAGVESLTNDSLRWLAKRTSPMWLSENGIKKKKTALKW